MIHFGTVEFVIQTIIIVVLRANCSNSERPIPSLHRPIGVSCIISVPSQPGGNVEEAALRDGVLVIVSIVEGENLPLETSTAASSVPSTGLKVEDGLSKSEPLRLT